MVRVEIDDQSREQAMKDDWDDDGSMDGAFDEAEDEWPSGRPLSKYPILENWSCPTFVVCASKSARMG